MEAGRSGVEAHVTYIVRSCLKRGGVIKTKKKCELEQSNITANMYENATMKSNTLHANLKE